MIHRIKKKLNKYARRLKKGVINNYPAFIHIYFWRKYTDNLKSPTEKCKQLAKSIYDANVNTKTILFYPDPPLEFHALYKTLMYLGYRISTNPNKHFDLAIKWWLAFDGSPFAPESKLDSIKVNQLETSKQLNSKCIDISKENINALFDDVFPYSITVDPKTYTGDCVMKSNWNALHEGVIVTCPTNAIKENVVFQKLINNETEDGFVKDMRVPIFKNYIPFVYLKYRKIKDRFVDRKHTGGKATIIDCNKVLSEEEIDLILIFCKRLGLDYGELDVLRNKSDGKIYIVDANNTPSGPTSAIGDDDGRIAIKKMAEAFKLSCSN